MEIIKNLLIGGMSISLGVKLILHFYLDMTFFNNYMEAIKLRNSYKRYISFYTRQEKGLRNILKKILNFSYFIFLFLWVLTLVFTPIYLFANKRILN